MNMEITDRMLWRGSDADFELHQRRSVSAAMLEETYAMSGDDAVHRVRPGPNFSKPALDFFGARTFDGDLANVPLFQEADRREDFTVRLPPGTLMEELFACLREHRCTQRAIQAWNMLTGLMCGEDGYFRRCTEESARLRAALNALLSQS